MKTRFLKVLRWCVIAAFSIVILIAVFVMFFEDRFIFFPSKYPAGQYAEAENIRGLTECWFKSEDGINLHAWFVPSHPAIATLVMAHGNAGNVSNRGMFMAALRQKGFNVFMFDYRGYGKSGGVPSEEGIYRDGRAAFDYATTLPQVDPAKVVLWGTSLGGAVAVDVAVHRKAAGLILESTFTSAADMAGVHYPFTPFRYFLWTKLNSIEKITRITMPVLVMHGDCDRTVPIRLGKILYAAAPGPKEFYEIQGADHNDTYEVGGEAYFEKVGEFVRKITE